MTRMVKEYLKTLKVLYHGGYCTCGTKWCNGHIVNNNFEELWTNHLKGLLYEYLRGKTNVDEKINRLYKAYKDTTPH